MSVEAPKPLPAGDVAVTVMTALPCATPVMTPVELTVATDGVFVPYVTTAAGAPVGCAATATSAVVPPTARLAVVGETVRVFTPGLAGVTLTVTPPVRDVVV